MKKVFLKISQNSQKALAPVLIKLQAERPATLLEKRLWHKCFLVNFEECLRTSGRLFLIKNKIW